MFEITNHSIVNHYVVSVIEPASLTFYQQLADGPHAHTGFLSLSLGVFL